VVSSSNTLVVQGSDQLRDPSVDPEFLCTAFTYATFKSEQEGAAKECARASNMALHSAHTEPTFNTSAKPKSPAPAHNDSASTTVLDGDAYDERDANIQDYYRAQWATTPPGTSQHSPSQEVAVYQAPMSF
jgi:hypothetical protein